MISAGIFDLQTSLGITCLLHPRFHVAWSSPLGDVHVDGMVKLYDLRSIQMHFMDYDSRGPKSTWFGLVDPRVTSTPDGRVRFDANMFWTVGLLYKHYGTCGVQDWDIEMAEMANTENWTKTIATPVKKYTPKLSRQLRNA